MSFLYWDGPAAIWEWEGFTYSCTKEASGYSQQSYMVKRIKGEWPPDETLIYLLDSGYDKGRFGGHVVQQGSDCKLVTVYTD